MADIEVTGLEQLLQQAGDLDISIRAGQLILSRKAPDGTVEELDGADIEELRQWAPKTLADWILPKLQDIEGGSFQLYKPVYRSLAEMKAATGLTGGQMVFLSDGGRSGDFEYVAGDFTAEVAADPLEGVYVKLDGVEASVGVLRRRYSGPVRLDWFGAAGDYDPVSDTGTDDTAPAAAWLAFPSVEADFSGGKKYKVTSTLAPGTRKIISGGDSAIYQRDIALSLFSLNGMDGSQFHGGDYSHNMDISDYNINNGKLFRGTVAVDDLLFYNVKIFKTAQQGIDLEAGGDNFQAVLCDIRETARDGIFLLNCTNPKVSLCTFKDTGDDSIACAGQTKDAIITNNNIVGAGSYNIGGSGIRMNRSGIVSGNVIRNSDLFGIIAAVNSADATAKPEGLTISNNTIVGINKTGTVTAGIGFKTVTSVSCLWNDIEMPSNEAHAYRVYDAASGKISIFGGNVVGAQSVLYVRNGAASELSIERIVSTDCTDHVLLDMTGSIDVLTVKDNEVNGAATPSYLRASSATTGTVSKLVTSGNRRKNPAAVAFAYNSKTFTKHYSTDDQFPTGAYSDTSGTGGLGSLLIDGRHGDIVHKSGSITFNATNSGLIPIGLSVVPLKSEIKVTQTTSMGSASNWHIDFADASNFRITLNAAPSASVTFDWIVDAYSPRKVI